MTDDNEPEAEPKEDASAPVQELTLEDALSNIDQACAQFQGNRQQHVLLQQSIQLVAERALRNSAPNRAARRAVAKPVKKAAPRRKRR